jgi:DNA-binding TFAR19-related protein (PDSD5 family)
MNDETEAIRRRQLAEINARPGSRESLEAEHGQVWDTQELGRDFTVEGFLAPYVVARRKADGQRGSLMFQNSPRFYFSFEPHRE